VRTFGNIGGTGVVGVPHPNDMVTDILGAMKQGASNIYGVRVTDGTDVAAKATMLNQLGAAMVEFDANNTGTWANSGCTVTVLPGSNATPGAGKPGTTGANVAVALATGVLQATATITVGTNNAGDSITTTISGTAIVATAGVSAAATATAIAAAVNANTTVNAIVIASASTNVVTVKALVGGAIGNSITFAVVSGGTTVVTASGSTLLGGTGTLSLKVVISSAFDPTEIFDNIVVSAYGVAGAALIVNAINNGIAGVRGPSNIVVAVNKLTTDVFSLPAATTVVGTTTGVPTTTSLPLVSATGFAVGDAVKVAGLGVPTNVNQTVYVTAIATNTLTVSPALSSAPAAGVAVNDEQITASNTVLLSLTGGTNGNGTITGGVLTSTSITGAVLVGVDGLPGGSRTGIYALRGLPITQFGVAGLTDTTQWANQLAFAVSEGYVVVLPLGFGIDSQSAVNTKLTGGVDDYHAVIVKDWVWLNDTFNKQIRLVSPAGPTLGRLGALSPERSPGNKPIFGYLGTERTGFFAANGTFTPGPVYSSAEIGLLETAGILFMTQPAVGGGYLALRHGQNASSDPTRNGINYSRMTIFLSKSLLNSMGFAVNELHTQELRRRVKSAISQFLSSLADPGPGRTPMIGDVAGGPAYSIVVDNTNNPPSLVAQGYMNVAVQVKYLSIVRFFIISIEAGQSVTVKVSQSPVLRPATSQAA